MLKRNLLFVSAMAVIVAVAWAQQQEAKHVPAKPTSAASGEEMFNSYCAVCHGKDGTGGRASGPGAEDAASRPYHFGPEERREIFLKPCFRRHSGRHHAFRAW